MFPNIPIRVSLSKQYCNCPRHHSEVSIGPIEYNSCVCKIPQIQGFHALGKIQWVLKKFGIFTVLKSWNLGYLVWKNFHIWKNENSWQLIYFEWYFRLCTQTVHFKMGKICIFPYRIPSSWVFRKCSKLNILLQECGNPVDNSSQSH